jgi:N-acetylmuramoyl-L-alanine amidase
MEFKIARHILSGDQVEYLATPKDSGLFDENLPDTLVIHFTAGSSFDSAVRTLRDPNVQASAHLVVGRDGRIIQLIPFNKIAWHAGKSEWDGRSGLNKYSIGIEIDNAGKLIKVGETYKAWYGGLIPADEVFYGTHRNESTAAYWHAYTETQILRVFAVCRLLRDKYNIKTIIGHEEIAPGRKTDPGPAFPLEKLKMRLLEDRSEDAPNDPVVLPTSPDKNHGVVTAASLNFRVAPSLDAAPKADPLAQGTAVQILEEQNGWYKVSAPQVGWVKKDYVRLVR